MTDTPQAAAGGPAHWEPGPDADPTLDADTDPTLDPAFDAEADRAVAALLTAYAAEPTAPMPASVAARLDAALAAEVAARAAAGAAPATSAESTAESTAGATVLAMEPARARRRRGAPSWAGVAAGVAVLALGGAVLAGPLDLFGGDSDSVTAGDAAEAPRAQAEAEAVDNATMSGTAYTTAALKEQVADLLAAEPADAGAAPTPTTFASPEPAAPDSGSPQKAAPEAYAAARALVQDKPALTLCVRAVAGGAAILAVDAGTFDGAPAVVAVLEVGGEPRLTDVYVVGPACSPADEQLLRYVRVPRP
jgi:hypothetical protein